MLPILAGKDKFPGKGKCFNKKLTIPESQESWFYTVSRYKKLQWER